MNAKIPVFVTHVEAITYFYYTICKTVPLTDCFYFVTVISTFGTACVFFVINLSAVALFVLGESFNCSNSLSLACHIYFACIVIH